MRLLSKIHHKNLVGLLLLLLAIPHLTGSTASAHFFYFNPDSSFTNFASLKLMMDSFLSSHGFTFSFQPFARFQDFDRQVKERKPSLVFLPEWYLKQDGNGNNFKPFMVPVYRGVTHYRKVLLVGANSDLTLSMLAGPTIAMTPVGPAGITMLNETIFKEHGLEANTLNFITTTKDSDALFALALGQVQAALISQNNLESIGKINPNILKTVKILAVSSPIPLPILCYAEGVLTPQELDKMRTSLLTGKHDKNTAQLMELLNIDDWQSPTL
ncbi:MAG: phosphate/phosphite/phosphonate ABC transporter substrate-binding protein [Proteobacteria bacterium]|nr:phosphate/phosphite/phosphonate ABC transporter substrate-binding protein [Desulfobulbaceae bacterium]MBU4154307.1 phosphate/phosphite/phosphonate ABC transporter substrate-binding protein [Pseudomonadota bacterium]